MKKLQNNFTTQEQSKRLLGLGLPKDSADCFYKSKISQRITVGAAYIMDDPLIKEFSNWIPCWSVGRLVEILVICKTKLNEELIPIIHGSILDYLDYKLRECSKANIIELIMGYIAINIRYIDFSKLKEK